MHEECKYIFDHDVVEAVTLYLPKGIESQRGQGKQKDNSKLFLIEGAELVGEFDIPKLHPCFTESVPEFVSSFTKAYSQRPIDGGLIYGYEADDRIERIWHEPRRYLPFLRRADYFVGPDLSLLIGMPKSMQIYNLYRNHALAYWYQKNGVRVVPSACWSDIDSFLWTFCGLPDRGTIAVSMTGAMGNYWSKRAFWRGLHEMFKWVHPDKVWLFGMHRNAEVENFISSKCDVEFINTNYHGR